MIRSGLLLGGGNATAALLGLVRNIAIARLISVEDFGIASTFAITMAMVEMASNMSLDRLLVQARDGEEQSLLSTLHAIQAARGVLGAIILFVIAGPLASLFGVPDVAWAYQALAVIPLLRGLAHLDMFRRQRELQFFPSVKVEVSAQLLATAAALPLALALGDHRAMLYVLLIQQIVFGLASHRIAVRPYRWAWNGEVVRRALVFGWPLYLNGFLMFAIFHGDRLTVGTLIGMTELGWYSAAFMLTMTPAIILARTLNAYCLPQLAEVQDDAGRFQERYLAVFQATIILGVLFAAALSLAGPPLFVALYGEKYAPALPLLVLFATMQGLRVARVGPTITAMARADTKSPLYANLPRAVAVPVAFVAVLLGGGLYTVVVLAIVGEGLSFMLAAWLLRRRLSLTLTGVYGPACTGAVILALLYTRFSAWLPRDVLYTRAMDIALVVSPILLLWTASFLRSWIRSNARTRHVIGGSS